MELFVPVHRGPSVLRIDGIVSLRQFDETLLRVHPIPGQVEDLTLPHSLVVGGRDDVRRMLRQVRDDRLELGVGDDPVRLLFSGRIDTLKQGFLSTISSRMARL